MKKLIFIILIVLFLVILTTSCFATAEKTKFEYETMEIGDYIIFDYRGLLMNVQYSGLMNGNTLIFTLHKDHNEYFYINWYSEYFNVEYYREYKVKIYFVNKTCDYIKIKYQIIGSDNDVK